MSLADDFSLRTPADRHEAPPVTVRERSTSVGFAVLSLGIGIAYLAGTADRFQGPQYELARRWAPWWLWGLIFVAYGVVLFASSNCTWHHAVLYVGTFFYVLFAASVIVSFFLHPQNAMISAGPPPPKASFVGPVLFGWLAGAHFLTARKRLHKAVEHADPIMRVAS